MNWLFSEDKRYRIGMQFIIRDAGYHSVMAAPTIRFYSLAFPISLNHCRAEKYCSNGNMDSGNEDCVVDGFQLPSRYPRALSHREFLLSLTRCIL